MRAAEGLSKPLNIADPAFDGNYFNILDSTNDLEAIYHRMMPIYMNNFKQLFGGKNRKPHSGVRIVLKPAR